MRGSMVNGQWSMVNGQWSMVNGQWSKKVIIKLRLPNGKRETSNAVSKSYLQAYCRQR